VGEHVILVCDSVSCLICGYDTIKRKISDILGIEPGESTKDNLFTLLTIPCLGACEHAPALMIDSELYWDLDSRKIEEILNIYKNGYRENGKTADQ
jgi:NADH-quinone oxidoreductase subunit E